MTTISTPQYLVDQARRRLHPTLSTLPGMSALERHAVKREWKTKVLAAPPPASELRPVLGNSGLPMLGHSIEMLRRGPDFALRMYRKFGPVFYSAVQVLPSVNLLGPDATQAAFFNKNKDFSQEGWYPICGPFFNRGLMLLDFDEHLYHKRIMQEAFTRPRLAGYVEHIDRVVRSIVTGWPTDDARFRYYPAAKKLTLSVASTVFIGHELGRDDHLIDKVDTAFSEATRAGGAFIRYPVPPFKWWRGHRGRRVLEEYFTKRVRERRGADGADMLTVLCHAEDEDGNGFTDADIVNHMIFLLMAAHDTTTCAITNMAYSLAAHPDWQERCRDESARLGDGPLGIEALEKLEALDLVMNESLRMVTPLPFTMRQTVRDTDFLGYYLPAGTLALTWPSLNHRLPEIWTQPEKFDPDRFTEPRSEHKKHRYAFAPFGGGAHKCIGLVFANLEAKTIMHRLLREYRLELPHPGYRSRWDYAGMPIPVDGMPLVLRSIR